MKLHFGILSTASIVPRFIRAAQSLKDCEVTALASRSLEKAREKATLWDVPKAFGSYEELIHSDEIDVIYIATINSEHYKYARLSLESGKHVLCEKPFTLHPEQSRELFALARKKGLFLMEAQKCVFLPVVQNIKELIRAGEFGSITMADFSSSFDASYNSWFFDPEKGGGSFYGNAVYSLQLMQFLFDCYAKEWTGICTPSPTGVENQFATIMRMENGVLFTNKTSTTVNTLHSGYLYGEKGYIEIPEYWKARKAILHYPDREPVVLEYPCDYELVYEILHVQECIRAGLTESPVMTEAMTVRAIEVLHSMSKSWQ